MEAAAQRYRRTDDFADQRNGFDPVALVDLVLLVGVRRRATKITIDRGRDPTSHRVTWLRYRHRLDSISLEGGTGLWVIDRLALLGGMDLAYSASATSRCLVHVDGRVLEVFITIAPGPGGPGAQVWLFDPEVGKTRSRELPALLPAGTVIGSYRIREVLGDGGMGIVYRADHLVLPRVVAIKVLRRCIYRDGPNRAEWLLREAVAAASIRHPGVVQVYDVATLADGRPYLVMEILQGTSLEAMIERSGMEPKTAVAIAMGIAQALEAAHQAGVIHRDLKPSNVFVSDDAELRVKLVDFGAAMMRDGAVAEQDDDVVLGTPHYIAPECIRGLPGDPRADLYALGVVLFEMLAGQVPFDGDELEEILRAHLNEPVPDLGRVRPDLPPALVKLVGKLLAKRPLERPAGAAQVAELLGRVAAEPGRRRRFWRRG